MNLKLLGRNIIVIIIFAALSLAAILVFKNITKSKDALPLNSSMDQVDNKKKIIAFGDSLTAGFGVDSKDNYPSLLQKKINTISFDYTVINAGISGETSNDGLKRVDKIIESKPQIVILEFGANDVLGSLSPLQLEQNLSMIIERLLKENIRIIIAAVRIQEFENREYFKSMDEVSPKLAQRYKLEIIPSFLKDVAGKSELNNWDGVHPNSKGYQIIVDNNVWPILEKYIK